MICEFCKQAMLDIDVFKKISTNKYTPKQIQELQTLRQEICNYKSKCSKTDCPAQDLINRIDNDNDIQSKLGL